MLQLSGEQEFDQAPETLWPLLTNPEFLCPCFPDVDRIVRSDERSAAVVVRPGFSFVRGTLDVSFEFVELNAPQAAAIALHVKGIGSSAELGMRMRLDRHDPGTRVIWTVDAIELGGLLKAVSQGLLKAAAQKVANDTWRAIRHRITA